MTRKWRNWSRIQTATPLQVLSPSTTEEVADIVLRAASDGRTIRMIGSGHSFTSTAVANDIMLTPSKLTNVRNIDVEAQRITVEAGINLTDLCAALDDAGLALTNMGDIRVQTLAGALQTGTHGTGRTSGTLAAMVTEMEIVLGDGTIATVNEHDDPDLFNSARVGMGAFGVVTAITLAVEPKFRLTAHEFPTDYATVHDSFDQWTLDHDHVEFYWFPHTEGCYVKHNDRTYEAPTPPGKLASWWEDQFLSNTVLGAASRLGRAAPGYIPLINKISAKALSDRTYTDESWRVFTSHRSVRFSEMEYSLPREELLATLDEVKALIEEKGWRISFPIEVRAIPGDDAWLSPATERDTGYIACHAFERSDRSWFVEIEKVLRAHGGRPHWGKLHTRTYEDLAPVYPNWERAMQVRNRVDPHRVFANEYTQTVLGD